MSKPREDQTGGELDVLREAQQLEQELDAVKADALNADGELMPGEMVRELLQTVAIKQGRTPTQDETPSAERAADIAKRAECLKAKALEFNAKVLQNPDKMPDFAAAADSLQQMLDGIAAAALKLSDTIAEQIASSFEHVADLINLHNQYTEFVEKLKPYLATELHRAQSEHPEAAELTLDDIVQSIGYEIGFYDDPDELPELLESLREDPAPRLRYLQTVVDIIIAAKAAFAADGGSVVELVDSEPPETPGFSDTPKGKRRYSLANKPEWLTFPLDSVNHKAFEGLLMGIDKATGKPHKVSMKKSEKSKNGVSVYVSIFSDGSELSEPLDIIDSDLLNMMYSYMLADNYEISLCRLLESYGQPRPTEKQLEPAYKRLIKLRNADITIDCKEWAKLKKRKTYSIYKRRILDGIAFEEIRNESTGALLDVIMHCAIPVQDLPLYQFAEMSGQITHLPMKNAMIKGDNSITSKTAAIRHILLERISRKHNSDKSGKITLFSTIYEKIGAETKTEKSRARDQVKRFMLEWVKNGTLYGFAFRKSGKTFDAVVFARSKEEMDEAKVENASLDTWYSR